MDDLLQRLQRALGDRFRVEERVARGGMGVVFRAHDVRHDRPVAVKVVSPKIAQTVGAERFLREVRVNASLNHPNIPALLDSGEGEDLVYFTMPFIEGPTLARYMERRGVLPLDEALEWGRQLAGALGHAHDAGIVHRDVKPSNVFIDGDHALLSDFGIALAMATERSERLTSDDKLIGTVEYMSPEQCSGSNRVGPPSDVYALGCVLYEMITGEPPLVGRTTLGVIARHLSEAPPKASALRGDVPPEIDALLARCLAKAPGDRFASGTALRDALESALRAGSTSQGGSGRDSVTMLGRTPERGPARAAWIVAVSAFVVAAALVARELTTGVSALDPYKVVGYPLADPGATEFPGVDAGISVGNVLEHTEPLRWRDGWTMLDPALRADPAGLTLDRAREIAEDQRAGHFITGRVTRGSEATIVRVALHSTAGDSIVAESSAEGDPASATVDQVAIDAAAGLLPALLDPGRTIDLSILRDRRPAARALVIQGDKAYRSARFVEALDFYERAVDADSMMVYAALKGSQAASWAEDTEAVSVLIDHAVRHDSVLPPRYREYARGLDAYIDGAADEAVEAFRSALADDSEWAEAWTGLGEVYRHLIPTDLDVVRSARDAFDRAIESDPDFVPPLVHRAEIAFREGDVGRGRDLMDRIGSAQPERSVAVDALGLMASCVDPQPGAVGVVPPGSDAALLYASHYFAAAGWRPGCGEVGFREILDDPDASRAYRFDALQGLSGTLIARGLHGEYADALSEATGEPSLPFLYLTGALVVPEIEENARRIDAQAASAWGPEYTATDALIAWTLAVWNAAEGDTATVRALARLTAARADTATTPLPQLVADAVRGHLLLLEGDSAAALDIFQRIRPHSPRQELNDGFVESFPVERLRAAELQLADGRYEDAWLTASVFDHPEPFIFANFVRRSLEIRLEAAVASSGQLWQDRANDVRRRLERLSSPSQPRE